MSIVLNADLVNANELLIPNSEDMNEEAQYPDRQRKAVSLQYHLLTGDSSNPLSGHLSQGLPRVASCNAVINETESNSNISHPTKLTGLGTMTESTALSSNAGKNVVDVK